MPSSTAHDNQTLKIFVQVLGVRTPFSRTGGLAEEEKQKANFRTFGFRFVIGGCASHWLFGESGIDFLILGVRAHLMLDVFAIRTSDKNHNIP